MRRGQHQVRRRSSLTIKEELLKNGLAGGDTLDSIRAAKQFIEQKQVRPAIIARSNEFQKRFNLRKVVAFAREEIIRPPDATAHMEYGSPILRRQASVDCLRQDGIDADVLRKVDFPDMLEPVTSTPRPRRNAIEFGTASFTSG